MPAIGASARWVAITLAHLAVVGVIGVFDVFSGTDFESRALHLLPVLSAAWYGGRSAGIVVAVAATVVLFASNDLLAFPPRNVLIPIWNTASRLIPFFVVVVLVDGIRTQAAALRANAAQLVRESALREEYIGLFVHEMRHAAAAISLAVATLTTSERIAPDERAYLDRLRAHAGDLEQLATQLLTIGRLESGSPSRERGAVDVDLRALAEAAVAGSPGAQRIDLRVPPEPAWASGDPEDLRRAVDNYLRNALMYSPPGSRVNVEVTDRDGDVGIDVRDAGVGFDPKERDLLFRKYGRLGNAKAREGAGLGLYLTRLIVEAHGGTVDATSGGPGRGATFSLRLRSARD